MHHPSPQFLAHLAMAERSREQFAQLTSDLAIRKKLRLNPSYRSALYDALTNTAWERVSDGAVTAWSFRDAAACIDGALFPEHGYSTRQAADETRHLDFCYSGREGLVREDVRKDASRCGWAIHTDEASYVRLVTEQAARDAEASGAL